MTDPLEEMLNRHLGGSILIDTNILLLLFVGGFDRTLISNFKRTATYTPEDLDLLLNLLTFIPNIVTTPHVLAEVNSLSSQLGEPKRTNYFGFFAEQLKLLDERYVGSAEASKGEWFPKIGLTDSGILTVAKDGVLVLTDDFRFGHFLAEADIDTINFNYLRTMNW